MASRCRSPEVDVAEVDVTELAVSAVAVTALAHPVTGQLFESPVPPCTGWPGDPATALTPVARTAKQVERLAGRAQSLAELDAAVSVCRACPRLVKWRETVATEGKRASFADQPYWGRPGPGFGDPEPGVRIVAAVRCAPPANKPTPTERDTCGHWLDRDLALTSPGLRSMLALGAFGWDATLASARRLGWQVPRPKPRFTHGAETTLVTRGDRSIRLLGSYHVSQQNTFTGKLTEAMLDE